MNVKEYYIVIHSVSRFIIGFLIVFLSLTLLSVEYFGIIEDTVFAIFIVLISISLGMYSAYKIGLGKGVVSLSNKGLTFKWKRSFILGSKENIFIPWNIVDNCNFHKDRWFDIFTINLTNKTRFKVNKFNFLPVKDDFYLFVDEFPILSTKLSSDIENSELISKK